MGTLREGGLVLIRLSAYNSDTSKKHSTSTMPELFSFSTYRKIWTFLSLLHLNAIFGQVVSGILQIKPEMTHLDSRYIHQCTITSGKEPDIALLYRR